MVTTNEKYLTYKDSKIFEVPLDTLKVLITLFIDHAALNLGCKATKADVDRIIEMVQGNEFSFLPVQTVYSAFTRGSLGKLKNEKTTLSPRNIYDWLSEVSLDYRLFIEHKDRDERLSANVVHFKDLERYPLGKAIMKKIDWELTEEEWERVPLKLLAEMIGRGEYVTMNDFGIKR